MGRVGRPAGRVPGAAARAVGRRAGARGGIGQERCAGHDPRIDPAVPKGQLEAARTLGLTEMQVMRCVRGLQAFRLALAPMTNDFVALLKDSSLPRCARGAEGGCPCRSYAAKLVALMSLSGGGRDGLSAPSSLRAPDGARERDARADLRAEPRAAGRRRARELGETLKSLATSGRTLVVTTHGDDFARDFADRVVILADGRVVEEGDPHHVLTNPSHPATQELLQRDVQSL